jgi:2-polyprenyl-6-methoxyphenol hydroxylase-like FAD-dependent oxidoreductase
VTEATPAARTARAITIVGGGQGGLQLAIGLRQAGHAVRLVQDRPAVAIAGGQVMSSQCMFATALAQERRLGLDLWAESAPRIERLQMTEAGPMPRFDFTGRLRGAAVSVDQRLKFPAWLTVFERLGGVLEIRPAEVADLERYASDSELVVVASGKGGLSRLFPKNQRFSPFSGPMRALSMVCLLGAAADRTRLRSIAVAGAGGIMRFPALTHGGACDILFFEATPGGPLDVAQAGMTAQEQHEVMRRALAELAPDEADGLDAARPTDAGAHLTGQITPIVRHALGRLPSGRAVLGLGDVVVLNDPLVGQGANNATKLARLYLDAILAQDGLALDEAWMEALAAAAWRLVRAATVWTNLALLAPSAHLAAVLQAATTDQAVADRFVHGFDDPDTLLPLLLPRQAA